MQRHVFITYIDIEKLNTFKAYLKFKMCLELISTGKTLQRC
jgi:hypothetical protein